MNEQVTESPKPPKLGVNIEWQRKGTGWDCREVFFVDGQRKRRHLAHIGRDRWEQMRAEHQGEQLVEALRAWVRSFQRDKPARVQRGLCRVSG